MKLSLITASILCSLVIKAQTPQVALVKPNGNTQIFSTWDEAYIAASDNDNIYLPGGIFTVTNPINKKLFIYGSGYNEDSSQTTGITKTNRIILSLLNGKNC